jgi:hypothetical protein
MRELDNNNQQQKKTKVEITQQKEDIYKLEFQQTIIPNENHTLFEIDIKTKDICIAKFESRDLVFNPKWVKGDKIPLSSVVIINDGKFYVSALNKKSALKKFLNKDNGSKRDTNKQYLKL